MYDKDVLQLTKQPELAAGYLEAAKPGMGKSINTMMDTDGEIRFAAVQAEQTIYSGSILHMEFKALPDNIFNVKIYRNSAKPTDETEVLLKDDGTTVEKKTDTIVNMDGSKTEIRTETNRKSDGSTIIKEIRENIAEVNGEIKRQAVIKDEKLDNTGQSVEKFEYDKASLGENVSWTTTHSETVEAAYKDKVDAIHPLNNISYDITPSVDGKEIQVNGGSVKVTLFYGDRKKEISHFRVYDCERNVWLSAYFKDGYIVFDATHFSKYIITEVEGVKKGDVTGDGEINLADAQMALKAALKIVTLSLEQISAADIDGNGQVDLGDAQRILKAALKIQGLD